MRKFMLLAALPVLIFASVTVACGGGDKKTVDIPGGGKISVSDDLPGDFPDDFPKYKGAKVLGSLSGSSEGQEGTVVTFETGDDIEDVQSFYEKEFEDGPWKSTSTGSFGGSGTFVAEKDDKAASVFIAESDGKVTILVTYGSKADLGLDDSSDSGDDSSDSGDDSEDPTPDDSDSSGDDSGDNGSAELPDEVDIDDDYPEDKIPLPDDARVTSSSSFSSSGTRSLFVELYVKQSVDDLESFYKDKLEAAGYTDSFSSTSDGEVFLSWTDAESTTGAGVIVTIGKADVDGYSKVSLSITGPE
ncbi:MAG: hypothetical protein HY873_04870 [Chloroflexi bacterium]|nr:hypothetical protein [Chloroflexota bacterium]